MEIKKLDQNAQIRKISVPGSGGYDLYCIKGILIKPGNTSIIPLGIALNIPEGYFVKNYSRSGMSLLRDIDIDSQYHGEIKLIIL